MLQSIVPLTSQRWENARVNAERLINARIVKPDLALYGVGANEHPRWLTIPVIGALIAVALSAFVWSAAKEIAVAYTTGQGIVAHFPVLGSGYVIALVVTLLALTEAGSLVFGMASHVFASDIAGKRKFWLFQVMFVFVAVVANVTISTEVPPVFGAFDWLLTFVAPLSVVGCGFILEAMTGKRLDARRIANDAYNQALALYQEQTKTPQAHPDFMSVWGECIIEQLMQQSKHNRETIPMLIEADPKARQVLAGVQFQRHSWEFNPLAELPDHVPGVSDVARASQKLTSMEQKIIDWLAADPERKNMSQRAIALELGTSPASVNRALQHSEMSETP